MKHRRVLMAKPTPIVSQVKENTSWTTAGQAKDIASSPNPLVKAYEEAVIESEARTTAMQLKSKV